MTLAHTIAAAVSAMAAERTDGWAAANGVSREAAVEQRKALEAAAEMIGTMQPVVETWPLPDDMEEAHLANIAPKRKAGRPRKGP